MRSDRALRERPIATCHTRLDEEAGMTIPKIAINHQPVEG
jgi:hypothetical protein